MRNDYNAVSTLVGEVLQFTLLDKQVVVLLGRTGGLDSKKESDLAAATEAHASPCDQPHPLAHSHTHPFESIRAGKGGEATPHSPKMK